MNPSADVLEDFAASLRPRLAGELRLDAMTRALYATDASVYQITPLAVALPCHEKDVLKALEIAADHQVSVLPRGGGTSLAGQTVGHSLILDFSKYMNQVLELNQEELGAVESELFARSLWAIWFGEHPVVDPRALMGESSREAF